MVHSVIRRTRLRAQAVGSLALPRASFRHRLSLGILAPFGVTLLGACAGGETRTPDSPPPPPTAATVPQRSAPKVSTPDLNTHLSCASCAIQLRPVVEFLDDEGDRFGGFVRFAEIEQGFLVGTTYGNRDPLSFFDRNGVFQRFIGREGSGPGELKGLKAISSAPSDGRIALMGGGRVVLIDDSLRPVLTRDAPVFVSAFRIIALPNGFAVNNYSATESPITFFDRDMMVTGKAGKAVMDPDSNQYVLAAAVGGGLWAARAAYAYEIVRISDTGDEIATLRPQRPWFRPWPVSLARMNSDLRVTPVPPRVTGMLDLGENRLAVLLIVADSGHKFPPQPAPPGEGKSLDIDEMPKYLDSVIEIIDATSGRVPASRRLDPVVGGISPMGAVWFSGMRGDTSVMQVFRLEVSR